MQTTDTDFSKSPATAIIESPAQSPAGQSSTSTPSAAPLGAPSPQSDLDPELSGLIDGLMKDIRKCTANALAWHIKIGVHLHQWRDGLGREDWLQLLHSGRLPFSARTAQSLARIGGHAALANPKHAFRLPDAVTVLNQLAKIPPTDLEQLIARNEVSAATTLTEARQLATEHRAKKAAEPPPTTMAQIA